MHVEAGLRSFDRSMPEEINRVLTDQISDLLFTTERAAHANLAREGIDMARVRFVGNVMIDSLLVHREKAPAVEEVVGQAGASARGLLGRGGFGVVTLHLGGFLRPYERCGMDVPVLNVVADMRNQGLHRYEGPTPDRLAVSIPNHASIMFSHEAPVGVKWKPTLGWASSHFRISGVE